MAESKINRDNYIVVQGWMISDLQLKGNELLIYACIHGFSQAENQVFNGGLQYLADWTKSTKQGVSKSLKALVEKGLVVKNDTYINGVKFCEYHATKFNTPLNSVEYPIKQSLTGGVKQSLTNNIDLDNLNNNLTNKKESPAPKEAKKKYGEFQHVSLKDSELAKLRKEYGEDMAQKAITHLDEYIEMKGYKARSHYLAIRKWVVDAVKEDEKKRGKGRKEPVPQWMESGANEIERMKRMHAAMTAGNSPEIAARAEALRQELQGG